MTGKGGVGRTTVSAALGILAARSGRRTIVCEVADQERITGVFGSEPAGFSEREVAPGLFALSVSPEEAQKEWLEYQLKSRRLADVLGHSRIFQYLTAAAPGLSELVTIGKVWELAQLHRRSAKSSPYDTVIVDAPATGHALAMLRSPATYREIARRGPIANHAEQIGAFVTDPEQTSMVAVALAEELPVNETLELDGALRGHFGSGLERVIVNALYPERFSGSDIDAVDAVDGRRGSEAARDGLRAARSEHRRASSQRTQLRRLRRELEATTVSTLPQVFSTTVGLAELEALADELERRA